MPQSRQLEREHDVGLRDQRVRRRLIQRMPRREVHAARPDRRPAPAAFGKLDQARHARRACAPRGRRRSRGSRPRRAASRPRRRAPESPCGGGAGVSFGMRSASRLGNRVLLQVAVERRAAPAPSAASSRSCTRAPRTRRSAASDAGWSSHFMKSRTSAAGSCALCTHSTPGRRVRRRRSMLPIIDVDRHAIALGVVDRHRRVLQADGAVRRSIAIGLPSIFA